MKKIFYLFAAISLALLVYSAIHLKISYSNFTIAHLRDLKGFDNVNPNDNYNRLMEKFREKITEYDSQAAKDQNRYFWLSFIVTALTAGSTLISSIQAAKKTADPNPKQAQIFMIIIALLTFCSTLANFASTHFNDLKSEETKKAADLVTRRSQFNEEYNKAAAGDKPLIITDYENRF